MSKRLDATDLDWGRDHRTLDRSPILPLLTQRATSAVRDHPIGLRAVLDRRSLFWFAPTAQGIVIFTTWPIPIGGGPKPTFDT